MADRSPTPPRRIALTGGIATGKSDVLARFSGLGVPTSDADLLAREAVAPGTPGLAAVVAKFGNGVLDEAGALDRRVLGRMVFADPAARRDLEAIVHPLVRAAGDAWFASLDRASHPYAIADIPLLYETGRDRAFDAIVVVACMPSAQLQRLMARDQLTREEAHLRIAAQWPIEEKVRRADYVISTDGSFADTERQVRALHARFTGPEALRRT